MYVFVYVFVSTKIGHEYSAFFDIIPRPRPFKMGIFDMNTGIDAVGSGDMSSTQCNRILSSANSFFRDRPSEFATTTTTFTENCVPLWKCIINCILKTHIKDSSNCIYFLYRRGLQLNTLVDFGFNNIGNNFPWHYHSMYYNE